METKNEKWILLLLVIGVWLIDFCSTMYYLNNGSGVTEANPLPALFFNHSLIATIIYFFIVLSFFSLTIILFPKIFQNWGEEYPRLFRWFIAGSMIGMEVATIMSNLVELKSRGLI